MIKPKVLHYCENCKCGVLFEEIAYIDVDGNVCVSCARAPIKVEKKSLELVSFVESRTNEKL